jgi:hypothetical protein
METSVSQYVLWMEFLEWQTNAFDKTCYYLAQIAAEVRRPYMPKGITVKIEDFIMKFTRKKVLEKPKTTMDVQMKANRVKQFFFGLTGLIGKGKRK